VSIDWDGTEAAVAAALRARGIETDRQDAELVAAATAARLEIAQRIGPQEGVIAYPVGGVSQYIWVNPPIGSLTSVVENGVTLTVDEDFRVRGSGGYIERLSVDGYPIIWGLHPVITYDAAVATDDRYDRVVVDLIKLQLEYSGLDSRRDGDYAEESKGARGGGGQQTYMIEREALISELVPTGIGFA
jgi:hypothetical protein